MFTFAGRVLVLATVLVVGAGFFWFVMFVNDNLPSGRYNVPFLLIPGVIGALVFFIVVSFILELVGIRVWTRTTKDDQDKNS